MAKLPPDYVAHPASYFKLASRAKEGLLKEVLLEHNIIPKRYKVLEGYSGSVPILVEDSAGRKYFVKIADEESIANEVYFYRAAATHKVSVPKLLHYDLSRKRVQVTYEVLKFVEGAHLGNSRSRLYSAGFFVGKEFRKIHKIRARGFGSVDDKFHWKFKDWLEALRYVRRFLKDDVARRLLSQREIDIIDEQTIYNRELDIKSPKLIHGDLWEGNMLYVAKSNRFVLTDAGHLIGGDPMYDLAYSTVPRTGFFEEGVARGYGLDEVPERDTHRFRLLRVFCIFKEAADYEESHDDKFKIDRLVKALRRELRSLL